VVPIIKRLSSLYWVSENLSEAKRYIKEALEMEKYLGVDKNDMEDTENLLRNISQGHYYLMNRPITIESDYDSFASRIQQECPWKREVQNFNKKTLRKIITKENNPSNLLRESILGR